MLTMESKLFFCLISSNLLLIDINELCFAVRMLLDHNADPNQKDIIGNTALHLGE